MRGSESLAIFKRKILKLYRPEKKSIFGIHDTGIKWIFQLRVGLSHLLSHKLRHNFLDTPSDICLCTTNTETTCHFLLECPLFNHHRRELFLVLHPILQIYNMHHVNNPMLEQLLLYGHTKFTYDENQSILKSTINFIRRNRRFTQE